MRNLSKIIVLSAMIISMGCLSKMTFPVLSEKIYRKHGDIDDKSSFKLNLYNQDARMKAFFLDSSAFLKGKLKDTLYILEGYNIEAGIFYGTILNKDHQVNYSYSKAIATLQKRSLFSKYQIKLIVKWDTTQIKKEEKTNGKWIDNNLLITGVRCYKQKNNWQIDEIYFKDFFDSKRDTDVGHK